MSPPSGDVFVLYTHRVGRRKIFLIEAEEQINIIARYVRPYRIG